jgi:hypothetical protein
MTANSSLTAGTHISPVIAWCVYRLGVGAFGRTAASQPELDEIEFVEELLEGLWRFVDGGRQLEGYECVCVVREGLTVGVRGPAEEAEREVSSIERG